MPKNGNGNPIEVVKINKVDNGRDEVFLYRADPYFNEVRYVRAGTYSLGPLPEEVIEKKSEEG